jgi:hypothetical protein
MDCAKMYFESESVPWPINLGNNELDVRNIVSNFCRPQRERKRDSKTGIGIVRECLLQV